MRSSYATKNPGWVVSASPYLFGVDLGTVPPYFEPQEGLYNAEAVSRASGERMTFMAHVLRASARTVEELINASVEADRAGAEQRRAMATDWAKGAKTAFGAADPQDEAYNTFAHGIRVLGGRWGLAATAVPAGISPMSLLQKAYGADIEARMSDQPVATAGQQRALRVVRGSGVLLPKSVLEAGTPSALRAALLAQLTADRAAALGVLPTALPESVSSELSAIVDAIDDADLVFAFRAVLNNYMQATQQSGTTVMKATAYGYEARQSTATEVAQLGGVALKGGISACDASQDSIARAGQILKASQASPAKTGHLPLIEAKSIDPSLGQQDSFMLGQALQQRLVVLRENAGQSSGASAAAAADVANKAVAEVRAWAGPGKVSVIGRGGVRAPAYVDVYLTGFEEADLLVPGATLQSQIALAYGPPWVGDCAAGLRTACPSSFEKDYLIQNSTVTSLESGQWRKNYGTDGMVRKLTFNMSGAAHSPAYMGTANVSQNLYVVLKNDPASAGGRGKVLASLAIRKNGYGTSAAVSRRQREQLGSFIGINRAWCMRPDLIGALNSAMAEDSCIPGVPTNMAVPLENELTSDSDGYESVWRHYLARAKEAARKADSLGEELIRIGLQQDERREAANERVAEICGDYSAMDSVTVQYGEPKAPASDKTLEACLNEERVDYVFLGRATDTIRKNEKEKNYEAVTREVQALLGCKDDKGNVVNSNPLCKRDPAQGQYISTAEMGIGGAAPNTPTPPPYELIEGAMARATSVGFNIEEIHNQSFAQPAALKNRVYQLQLTVSPSFEWTLSRRPNEKLMDSEALDMWPGCLRSGDKVKGQCGGRLAEYFNRIYRTGASDGSNMRRLGTGDGEVLDDTSATSKLLLWRVEGSLAVLSALAQTAPDSLFEVPIPARDFGPGGANEPDVPAMPATLYGKSQFQTEDLNGDHWWIEEGTNRSLAARSIGATWQPVALVSPAAQWIDEIYANQNRFLHIEGVRSEALTFEVPPDGVSSWLRVRNLDLANSVCGYGPSNKLGDRAEIASAEIARLKSGGSSNAWGRVCNKDLGTALMDADYSPDYGDRNAWWSMQHELSGNQTTTLLYDGEVFGWTTDHDTMWHIVQPNPLSVLKYSDIFDGYWHHEDDPGYRAAVRTRTMLLPSECPPEARARVFVNYYPSAQPCAAALELLQALGLAALTPGAGITPVDTPPVLQEPEDIAKLEAWIDAQSRQMALNVSNLHIESVPRRALRDVGSNSQASGSLKGANGQLIPQLEKGAALLVQGYANTQTQLDLLRDALSQARLEIAQANLAAHKEQLGVALARLNLERRLALAAAHFAASMASPAEYLTGNVTQSGAAMEVEGAFAGEEYSILEQQAEAADTGEDLAVQLILSKLHERTAPVHLALQTAMRDMIDGVSEVSAIGYKIEENQQAARYEVAKGTGQDYYRTSDGKIVKFPVNAAYRRQYDITRIRYLRALQEAKYLAYVARLAVEQRLGVRLNELTQGIGPLDPPAQWADKVCGMTGIDYKELTKIEVRDPPDTDAGSSRLGFAGRLDGLAEAMQENMFVTELANQYIGDYVSKLENLVDYYNIEYPSRDGDDTVVLSLREHLLPAWGSCMTAPRNLLYHSDRLERSTSESDGTKVMLRGWRNQGCSYGDEKCLKVEPQEVLAGSGGVPVVPPGSRGSITWLHDVGTNWGVGAGGASSEVPAIPEAGAADPSPLPKDAVRLPDHAVTQQVVVTDPGIYVLSWFDQARGSKGEPGPSGAVSYVVKAFDSAMQQLGEPFIGAPYIKASQSASDWSERRSLVVNVPQAGVVYVSFSASLAGSEMGSVAIANVQLEQGGEPTPYVSTTATREVVPARCKLAAEQLRASFKYTCGSGQCYYELKQPLEFWTRREDPTGKSKTSLEELLRPKSNPDFAQGNFNYRHISWALNLAGTGVHSCGPGAGDSCYATGYIEYTLSHNARRASIVGWDGALREFNFETTNINYGKALAAERFITMPLASNDQALLSQPGIEKQELRGRPLEGTYRLMIMDGPGLVWRNLEDVQIVLKYRYWSATEKQPGNP